MKCNCKSTNWDIGKIPEVIVNTKDYFPYEADICIDACIVDSIKALWSAGIETGGSCCGHNKKPPTVILINESDASKAEKILKEHDSERQWKVMFWTLTSKQR